MINSKMIKRSVGLNDALWNSSCPTGEDQTDRRFHIESDIITYTVGITTIQLTTPPSFEEKIVKEDTIVNTSPNDDHFDSGYISQSFLTSSSSLVIR